MTQLGTVRFTVPFKEATPETTKIYTNKGWTPLLEVTDHIEELGLTNCRITTEKDNGKPIPKWFDEAIRP